MKTMKVLVVFLVVLLCLTSCGENVKNSGSLQQNDDNQTTTSEAVTTTGSSVQDLDQMTKIIASIKDEDAKSKLKDFISCNAYGDSHTDGDQGNSNSDYVPVDMKAFQEMAELTGKDLDEAIGKQVETIVKSKIDDSNITWNKSFVETYVKQYCPKYYDELMKKCK